MWAEWKGLTIVLQKHAQGCSSCENIAHPISSDAERNRHVGHESILESGPLVAAIGDVLERDVQHDRSDD